ncbi:MAG: hypothetical protein ABSF90_19275 [Syntrophobacteraceae bacterium]
MPTWKVKLTSEARGDFRQLDGRQKLLVAKRLAKLEKDPQIGKHLGNKIGMDRDTCLYQSGRGSTQRGFSNGIRGVVNWSQSLQKSREGNI